MRGLRWTLWGLLAVLLVVTFVIRALGPTGSGSQAETPMVLGRAPAFELLGHDGGVVRSSDLAGRIWVADFIFTRCALSCPRLTSLMRRLGADAPDVVRVSFSVDPENDTPQVLADYAASYGITDPDWLFLTGPRSDIEAIVIGGFKLPIVADPPPGTTHPDEPILHSNRFVLVDPSGAIRGYYEVAQDEDYAALLRDLAIVRAEPMPPVSDGGGETMDTVTHALEIEELHEFFEAWFLGSLPDTDEALDRFASVLADDFAIIGPDGVEFDRVEILDRLRGGHGARTETDFEIWIDNVQVRHCDDSSCLLTYEEWQRVDGQERGRVSTVLMGPREGAPNGLEWRHVQETWLPDPVVSANSE